MKTYLNGLLGLVLYLVITQSNAAFITLNVPDSNIVVGESFVVEVSVVDAVDLLAFGFDTSWLFNNVLVAAPFIDDSLIFPEVAGSIPFPETLSGGAMLATLSFTASLAGTFDFRVLSDTNNINQGLIELLPPTTPINSSTSITINEAPIPEPPIFLVMLLGLLGIVKTFKLRVK